VKAKELMTSNPLVCGPETTVADAAQLMWKGDCGALPVVEAGKLVGIVTDRDMYIALATRDVRASELKVGEVATRNVATCEPEDDIVSVLHTMKTRAVRRLPVIGFGGTVLGILSMNDVVLSAGAERPVRNEDVVETLHGICGHHHALPQIVAA
jgi:CBS domain-containing protein